jgi:glycosyltransferase involved in cell wall biosynthesis
MLLRTRLAQGTGMRLFNTYRRRDASRPFRARLLYQAGMVRAFRSEMRRFRPDLVHVKTSSGINFYQNSLYVHAARLAGLPVILQLHCGKFEAFYRDSPAPLKAWIRYTLRSARRVAVLSNFWKERLSALAPGTRLVVIPNGLEQEEIDRLAGPYDRLAAQVLFVGTGEAWLNREKGIEDLLAVLPRMAADYPSVTWVLAGLESPEEAEGWWRKHDVPRPPHDRVLCKGVVSGEERVGLLRDSGLLVLPSYFENMPNIVLEAMAAGLAVVATRVGALPEMLAEDQGGLLVPAGDQAALEGALRRALDEGNRLADRGRRNRATVERHHTLAVVERGLEAVYREIALPGRTGTQPAGEVAAARSGQSRAGVP